MDSYTSLSMAPASPKPMRVPPLASPYTEPSSPSTLTSAKASTFSNHESAQTRSRPALRRPSDSAPGLSMQAKHSPIVGAASPPLSPRPENATLYHVLESHHVQRHHNRETGNPIINNYEFLGDVGAGVHGKVKKAKDIDTGQVVAIKIVNRVTKKRLGNYDPNEQENKIKREIAIMKKCHHPNIVNLIAVIDDPNSQKVYLVLEYVEGGEIKWRDKNNRPILTVDQIRPMMRDVVLGLEYLHFQGIIHRDIKPGNLLISNNGAVKISDFGVSHLAKMDEAGNPLPENDLDLAKTAGSPAFFAPELCQFDSDKPRQITNAIDVWALGITFYCLLFGREPFPGVYGEMELYDKICKVPIEPPEEYANLIDVDTKDLLSRLLTKNCEERIRLPQVRRHPFITKDLPNPKKWAEETDLTRTSQPLEVTPQEVESAVTSFRNIVRRTLAQVKMTARRSVSYLRSRQSSGRIQPGDKSPVIAATTPNSPPSTNSSAGARDVPVPSRSPKSDTTELRSKVQHAYFNSVSKSLDITPPTPPHSGRVGSIVPNGHVNGHYQENGPSKVMTPRQPPTPPPIFQRHLNDDYSNLYYSGDDDVDYFESDSNDESDDGDRLEMRFGSRRV